MWWARGVEIRGGYVYGGIQRKGAKTQRCKEAKEERGRTCNNI